MGMQRRTTVPAPRRHRSAASGFESGLIGGEEAASRSAAVASALDNRSHRTAWGSAAGHFSAGYNVCERRYQGASRRVRATVRIAPDCSYPSLCSAIGSPEPARKVLECPVIAVRLGLSPQEQVGSLMQDQMLEE